MTRVQQAVRLFAAIGFALMVATGARAAVTRTWVSGLGNDNNPCSYTAPCATFAGAYAKTAINGEINCLDSGEYGKVTINHSLTINCRDAQGFIRAPSFDNGVEILINSTVAEDPLATVRLSGLSINGTGSCGGGCGGSRSALLGIYVSNNSRKPKVFVEDTFIHGFTASGIHFIGPGELIVNNCTIIDIGTVGIMVVSPTEGQPVTTRVTIDKTRTDLNEQGVRFEDNTFGVVKDSTASNNRLNGYVVFPTVDANAEMTIRDSITNNNRQYGVFSGGFNGVLGTVRLVNTTAIHNTTSQLAIGAGGTICTNQKNHIGVPSDVPSPCFVDQ